MLPIVICLVTTEEVRMFSSFSLKHVALLWVWIVASLSSATAKYMGDPSSAVAWGPDDPCSSCSYLCVAGECACPEGFNLAKDYETCIDVDECLINNGGCVSGLLCVNTNGTHYCECSISCRDGYELQGTTCADSCKINNGGCSHICGKSELGEIQCDCPNSQLKPDQRTCADPCIFQRGGCSDFCVSNAALEVTCSCPEDWELDSTGKRCQLSHVECPLRQRYDNHLKECVDKCADYACAHSCDVDNTTGNPFCHCREGYEVDLADYHLCRDTDECYFQNGGCHEICENTEGSYKCSCHEGELDVDHRTCTVVNVCEDGHNGGCNHTCVHQGHEGYTCECDLGHILGNDSRSCIDICLVNNGGCGTAICLMVPADGSVKCYCDVGEVKLNSGDKCADECPPGYDINMESGRCNSKCLTLNGGCEDQCDITASGVVCSCPSGGVLMLNEQSCLVCAEGYEPINNACEDIDECDVGTSGCEQLCNNSVGGYVCGCTESELATNGKNCTVVDECKFDNGGCLHDCVDVSHREYRCECWPGYVLDSDHHHCVDKCSLVNGTGGCGSRCRITNGEVECYCDHGFELDADSINCHDVCDNPGTCAQICTHTNESMTAPGEPMRVCSCRPGFVYIDDQTCKDRCIFDNFGCEKFCNNDHLGDVSCSCNDDEVLDVNGKECHDRNECEEQEGVCAEICVNDEPSYHCECTKGELSTDGRTCTEVDECLINNGTTHGCMHMCVHESHRLSRCECYAGYELADDKKTCLNKCHVKNGDCMQICAIGEADVECDCVPGYRLMPDTVTCSDIDECADGTARCERTCANTEGSFVCECPDGYYLHTNGRNCTDINACEEDNGGCSHSCTDGEGMRFVCTCPKGMKLLDDGQTCMELCEIRNGGCASECRVHGAVIQCDCPPGFGLMADGINCADINECVIQPPVCQQTCLNTNGSYSCGCFDGFQINPDQVSCSDTNECEEGNHNCSDICENIDGGFKCSCPDGFELIPPGNNVCRDILECSMKNGDCEQICEEKPGSYECSCMPGYVLQIDGQTCMDYPECDDKNGDCEQTCTEKPGYFTCSCHVGYLLHEDGKNCTNIDECGQGDNGNCDQTCRDTDGSYFCSCANGFTLSLDSKTCFDVNECANDEGGCADICTNTEGGYYCSCYDGYQLNADNRTCSDVDECQTDNDGGCEHKCFNSLGSFTCACNHGYTLKENLRNCVDIDECMTPEVYKCEHGCNNTVASYDCTCLPGYELAKDLSSCFEIDRCAPDNGGCEQKCASNITLETAVCTCGPGYNLNVTNNQTCDDIDECAVNKGGCRVDCNNQPGTYRCECYDDNLCQVGYEHDRNTDQCHDKDECLVNNGDCSELCTNQPGSHGCSCYNGYAVDNYGQCGY